MSWQSKGFSRFSRRKYTKAGTSSSPMHWHRKSASTPTSGPSTTHSQNLGPKLGRRSSSKSLRTQSRGQKRFASISRRRASSISLMLLLTETIYPHLPPPTHPLPLHQALPRTNTAISATRKQNGLCGQHLGKTCPSRAYIHLCRHRAMQLCKPGSAIATYSICRRRSARRMRTSWRQN